MKLISSKIILSTLLFATGKIHPMHGHSQSDWEKQYLESVMIENTRALERRLIIATYKLGVMLPSRPEVVDTTWPKANKTEEPIITLGLIDNQMTYPNDVLIEWIIDETEIDHIRSGRKHISNRVLFSRKDKFPLTKRLDLEANHLMKEGSRKFKLKLEMETSHLKIVKDFSDSTQRPQEFYPIEPGKEYLLNLTIQKAADGNGDEVVTDLVEDSSTTPTE